MNHMNKRTLYLAVAILAALTMVFMAGCQGAAPVAKGGANNSPNAVTYDAKAGPLTGDQSAGSNGISVSGQGTISVKPDVAYVSLGVETLDTDATKARKANDAAMAKVIAAVKGFGVTDEDITTTNFSIYPRYDDKGQTITGFTVSNSVNVAVKSLDKLGGLLTAASAAGANTAGGINFDVLDRTAAYNQALAQAMDKAKARADVMAKACGVKLGNVLTINESSSYSGPVFASASGSKMDLAAGAPVPVSGGQLDVTATVNVVYEIVK